jgi:AraC-like DNA-binding protein
MGKRHGLVRITALSGYQRVADRLGLDTGPLLRAAGVTPILLSEPEQFVPAEPLADLLEESARQSGCATLGLQIALERSMSDMGLISVLMAVQHSFSALLETLGRYRNTIVPIITLRVERHDDIGVIDADLALPSDRPHRQANELLLGTMVGMARAIIGPDWHPECTYFAYPAPAPSDRSVYHSLFGPALQFNADFNGFTATLADLDRWREGADPGLAHHARRLVHHMLNPDEPTLVQRVQEAVTYLLGSSRATAEDTARVLGLHPRTLQRRLEREGVTFRGLVSLTRVQLVSRFLSNRTLSIAEVAEALGYSSTGAFSRWYRQEFGRSPQQARASSPAS